MEFKGSTTNIIDSVGRVMQLNPSVIDGSLTLTDSPTPKYIELSITEALRVIEETVKFLNKKNDGLQQHIRTEKDKQNQKIRDEIDKVLKLLKPQLEERKYRDIDAYTESIDEKTRKYEVVTKIRLLEQILEKSVGKTTKFQLLKIHTSICKCGHDGYNHSNVGYLVSNKDDEPIRKCNICECPNLENPHPEGFDTKEEKKQFENEFTK